MTAKVDTLQLAKEMVSHAEKNPMYATGLTHMSEAQFLKIVLRAKRLLVAKASRAGQEVSADEPEEG